MSASLRALLVQLDAYLAQGEALRAQIVAIVEDGDQHDDEWISARECALPVATRRRAVKAGEIEARRVGRELWLRRSDVDRWIESQPSEATRAAKHNIPSDLPKPIRERLEAGRLRSIPGGRE